MIPAPSSKAPTATIAAMESPEQRREALSDLSREAHACVRCALAKTRTTVVFGSGDPDAELMFIGEAPGKREDEAGTPFIGAAGKLLDKLLGEIGMQRSDVFVANVLKCRPPDNRDPRPSEIEECSSYLHSQISLIAPRLICTLGNFSTKLLRADPTGITELHGSPEVVLLGGHSVRLYPVFHPAAALYKPSAVEVMRADFARIPALLKLPLPDPQEEELKAPSPAVEVKLIEEPGGQIGMF